MRLMVIPDASEQASALAIQVICNIKRRIHDKKAAQVKRWQDAARAVGGNGKRRKKKHRRRTVAMGGASDGVATAKDVELLSNRRQTVALPALPSPAGNDNDTDKNLQEDAAPSVAGLTRRLEAFYTAHGTPHKAARAADIVAQVLARHDTPALAEAAMNNALAKAFNGDILPSPRPPFAVATGGETELARSRSHAEPPPNKVPAATPADAELEAQHAIDVATIAALKEKAAIAEAAAAEAAARRADEAEAAAAEAASAKQQRAIDAGKAQVAAAQAELEAARARQEEMTRELSAVRKKGAAASELRRQHEADVATIEALKEQTQGVEAAKAAAVAETQAKLEVAAAAAEKMRAELVAEQAARRKLHNHLEEIKGNIRVFARVRPMSESERARGCAAVVECPPAAGGALGDLVVLATGEKAGQGAKRGAAVLKEFAFTRCFTGASTQDEVFRDVRDLVQSAVDGVNVCIFAYGQTGSGKTYTMNGGEGDARGITPRSVQEIFANLDASAGTYSSAEVECFALELHCGKLIDLLFAGDDPRDAPRLVIMQRDGATVVEGVVKERVASAAALQEVLDRAVARRHVSSTLMNAESSRSHLIFQIEIRTVVKRSGVALAGKLTLVDLAGSEKVDKSGATGDALKEAMAINKSLSALGDVISMLNAAQQEKEKAGKNAKSVYIPYRSHPLTHLMSDSLGGNAKTLMFVNLSPADYNLSETKSSLQYAARVKKVTNKKDEGHLSHEVVSLKAQLAELKAEVARDRGREQAKRKHPSAATARTQGERASNLSTASTVFSEKEN